MLHSISVLPLGQSLTPRPLVEIRSVKNQSWPVSPQHQWNHMSGNMQVPPLPLLEPGWFPSVTEQSHKASLPCANQSQTRPEALESVSPGVVALCYNEGDLCPSWTKACLDIKDKVGMEEHLGDCCKLRENGWHFVRFSCTGNVPWKCSGQWVNSCTSGCWETKYTTHSAAHLALNLTVSNWTPVLSPEGLKWWKDKKGFGWLLPKMRCIWPRGFWRSGKSSQGLGRLGEIGRVEVFSHSRTELKHIQKKEGGCLVS